MSVDVKICGILEQDALKAAIDGGARYAGFVFVPNSKRCITPIMAHPLAEKAIPHMQTVGLFVNPSDEELLATVKQVPLNIIQLHGHETPERVSEVGVLTGLGVMKVIHVAKPEDLESVPSYENAADILLFDTKLGPLPTGGTGITFDWSLLKGKNFKKPWMLAGGINIGNIVRAVEETGARIIDLSSGVENETGQKDPEKIRTLLKLAKTL